MSSKQLSFSDVCHLTIDIDPEPSNGVQNMAKKFIRRLSRRKQK
jgi:hypothetical protein